MHGHLTQNTVHTLATSEPKQSTVEVCGKCAYSTTCVQLHEFTGWNQKSSHSRPRMRCVSWHLTGKEFPISPSAAITGLFRRLPTPSIDNHILPCTNHIDTTWHDSISVLGYIKCLENTHKTEKHDIHSNQSNELQTQPKSRYTKRAANTTLRNQKQDTNCKTRHAQQSIYCKQ